MIIWSTISDDEKLKLWRTLRKELSNISEFDRLQVVAEFCRSMPYETRTIDYYSPDTWPSPWDVMYHGSFCQSSISLLMYYTMKMVDEETDINLTLINDGSNIYLVPVYKETHVLNFILGAVSTMDDLHGVKILQAFSSQIKKYN